MKGNVPSTMKALVAYSATDYRFEPAYPVPECGPDDIIIKTEGCGICAGDLKCQHGASMFWGTKPSQAGWSRLLTRAMSSWAGSRAWGIM